MHRGLTVGGPDVPAEAFLKAASSKHSTPTPINQLAMGWRLCRCAPQRFQTSSPFLSFCCGLESGNPKPSSSSMYTSALCAQSRPTSSLCAVALLAPSIGRG